MNAAQAVVGCMLFAVAHFASAGFDEGMAAYEQGDYKSAIAEFWPLAQQGDASAQFSLGVMYKEGQGAPQDYKQAVSWFRKAGEQGHARAQYSLGVMYYSGQGVTQDYKQAVYWSRKAADQDFPHAQTNLGVMYKEGQGVPRDDKQAVSWFRKAAEQGHAEAQFDLGVMYYIGQGVPQDNKQAVSWFRKAAEQGHATAQTNLGVMYNSGQGVQQDINEAEKWFRLAANQGDSKAKEKLQDIEDSRHLSASMDSDQANIKQITDIFINIGKQEIVSEIMGSGMTSEQCYRVVSSTQFNYEKEYSDVLVDFVLDRISAEELDQKVNSLELEKIISGTAVKTEIEQEHENSIVTGLAKCKLLQAGYNYTPPPSPFEFVEMLQKASTDKKHRQQAVLPDEDSQLDGDINAESDQVAGDLDDLLIRLVSEQWQRPPSARNGMSVEVLIEMLPDGTISNASVTRSSGDRPFDNSAVAAVRNVGRIQEMQQLDRATFDAMYRQRRVIFKPEDLSL